MMAKPQMWWPGINRQHPLAQGLVGAWLFNEGAGLLAHDLSEKGNHVALTNMDSSSDWVGGERGYALNFDGGNVEHLNRIGANITVSDKVSVVAWIRPSILGGFQRIFTYGDSSNFNEISLLLNGTSLASQLENFGHNDTGGTLSVGTRHHVGFTFDGSTDTKRLYLDGIEVGSFTDSTVLNVADGRELDIGRSHEGIHFFNGDIETVSIYNRFLKAREFKQLYYDSYVPFRLPSIARRHAAAPETVSGLARMLFLTGDI